MWEGLYNRMNCSGVISADLTNNVKTINDINELYSKRITDKVSFWDFISFQAIGASPTFKCNTKNIKNAEDIQNYSPIKNQTYCFGCGAVINKSQYKCDYCGNWY